MANKVELRYAGGEAVRVGDVVRQDPALAEERVAEVFYPDSAEAEGYFCNGTGGLLLEPSCILFFPGKSDWANLELIRRGDST